jgi:hypothetical protein
VRCTSEPEDSGTDEPTGRSADAGGSRVLHLHVQVPVGDMHPDVAISPT